MEGVFRSPNSSQRKSCLFAYIFKTSKVHSASKLKVMDSSEQVDRNCRLCSGNATSMKEVKITKTGER